MPVDIEALPQSDVGVLIESELATDLEHFDLQVQTNAEDSTFLSGKDLTVSDINDINKDKNSSSKVSTPVKAATEEHDEHSWLSGSKQKAMADEPINTIDNTAGAGLPPLKPNNNKGPRRSPSGAPILHTAQRSRSRGMSMTSDTDGVDSPLRATDSPGARRTPPPVKTASPSSRHVKEAAGKASPKGPTFDKQTSRPEFITYANVNKAAPSGILPTPPKRHSASRLSMGSETGEMGNNSPTRAVASRTPTSLDTPLPLTPTAGPAVSDLSEQPGQYQDDAGATAKVQVASFNKKGKVDPMAAEEDAVKPGCGARLFKMFCSSA